MRTAATRVIALLLLTMAAFAQEADAPSSPATSPVQDAARPLVEEKRLVDKADERVSILSNGLTVLLKAHRTAPVVSVRMYCRTGSIYEQEYLGSGMSHLFEHLLHGGATTRRPEEESRDLLDQIGGNTNAYTTYDVTCYFINTARQHTETAIDLLGDWITDPTFPDAAFQREWGVVQRELERDVDNPQEQLYEMTMQTMYREHPVRHPIIGYQPVVQKLTKEDIVGYYQRMYVPDNILVSIAGDIDLDGTLATVASKFSSFSRRRVPNIVLPEEPPITTPRMATKRMKVPTAMMQLVWPSIPLTHPDLYALDVLSYVLTQGESSRLARAIRDKGLVYAIDSASWTPAWARGTFIISSRLSPTGIEAAKQAILAEIARVRNELIDVAELEQAQNQKAAEHVMASQTADSVAEMMAQDFLATGDVHFSGAYVANIRKVTIEQIWTVARRYLDPQQLATITVVPDAVAGASEAGGKVPAPQPVRLVRLKNGVRCLIRSDPTTPLVAIQAYALGGVLLETPETNGFSRLAALLAPRGTTTRSAEQIARFFENRGGSLDGTSANNTLYFQAEVLKKDFADAFEVFADVVCHPAFPAAEMDVVRPQVLDQIEQIDESWRTELIAYLQRKLFPNSPYGMQAVGSRPVVSRASAQEVAAFYRRCFNGPATVIAVFGDVQADEVEALAGKYFGGMPTEPAAIPAGQEPAAAKPLLFEKEKPPTRSVAGVGVGFHGMRVSDVADVTSMAMLDTVMSGYRYPTGWLFNALRGGSSSLVYEVHAQNIPGPVPGSFIIYAACEPNKVGEVYRIIAGTLERAKAGRFEAAELERARNIIVTTELMETQTNSDRAMQASIDELYGLGHDYRARFLERIQSVTPDDMRRVATKYFTAPVIAVVTPDLRSVEIGVPPTAIDREAPATVPAGEDPR